MRIFTISNNSFEVGATVTRTPIGKSGTFFSNTINVGEEGRGRFVGQVAVKGTPTMVKSEYSSETAKALNADVTPTGGIVLTAPTEAVEDSFICRYCASYAHRGSNSIKQWSTTAADFVELQPIKTLTKGRVADGTAGSMSGGDQAVYILPAKTIFKVRVSGNRSQTNYYFYDGVSLNQYEQVDIETAAQQELPIFGDIDYSQMFASKEE